MADELPRPIGEKIGRVEDYRLGASSYLEHLKSTISHSLAGLKVVLDCANGASSCLAPKLFHDLGADVVSICHEPNGININEACGSTHPQTLAEAVVEHGADLGFAFDGDCDRLIAVDHTGAIVDGDYIMFIVGCYLNEKGKLRNGTVVSTVMQPRFLSCS